MLDPIHLTIIIIQTVVSAVISAFYFHMYATFERDNVDRVTVSKIKDLLLAATLWNRYMAAMMIMVVLLMTF